MSNPINEFWKSLVDLAPGCVEVDVGTRWSALIDSDHCVKQQPGTHPPRMWKCKRGPTTIAAPRFKFEPAGYTFEVRTRTWNVLVCDTDGHHVHWILTKLSYDPQSISLVT
jgi:hypothetical protein